MRWWVKSLARVKIKPKPHGGRNGFGNRTSGNAKRRRRADRGRS